MYPEFTTLTSAIQHWGEVKADSPAFIFRDPDGGRVVQTFGQVYRQGAGLAARLRQDGIGRGSLVADTLPNSPERVACEAGTQLSGAASINALCLLADGSDLVCTLRESRARAVFIDPDVTHSPWAVLRGRGVSFASESDPTAVTSAELPHLERVYLVRRRVPGSEEQEEEEDFLAGLEAAHRAGKGFVSGDVTADDVCSVFTTSGSSGFSKLVVHTHGGLSAAVLVENPAFQGLKRKDVELSLAPLGWLGGFAGNTLLAGSTRVLCDARAGLPRDVAGFMLDAFREENVALTFVPGPRLAAMLDRVKVRRGGQGEPGNGAGPGGSSDASSDTHRTAPGKVAGEGRSSTGAESRLPENRTSDDAKSDDASAGACRRPNAAVAEAPGQDKATSSSANTSAADDESNARSSGGQSGGQEPDLRVIKRITLGGQPIPRHLVKMAARLAHSVCVLYGLTETFTICAHVVSPATYQDYDCGKVSPACQVKVVSADASETPLPVGQLGRILYRRPLMMRGYLNDPEANAAALTPDGFFRTGDVGWLGEGGSLFVQGREGDAIARGPYLFYPGWLEERIRACPGVSDAMVVGVPDPDACQQICACVTLASGTGGNTATAATTVEEVRRFVEREVVAVGEDETPLSPRPLHYLAFPAFPTTATGKPLRPAVQRQASERLSTSSE